MVRDVVVAIFRPTFELLWSVELIGLVGRTIYLFGNCVRLAEFGCFLWKMLWALFLAC